MKRYRDLDAEWWYSLTTTEREAWCLWFKRHGFDPNYVFVSTWKDEVTPLAGWVECDDDARTITTLSRVELSPWATPVTVQLEAPAMAFPGE